MGQHDYSLRDFLQGHVYRGQRINRIIFLEQWHPEPAGAIIATDVLEECVEYKNNHPNLSKKDVLSAIYLANWADRKDIAFNRGTLGFQLFIDLVYAAYGDDLTRHKQLQKDLRAHRSARNSMAAREANELPDDEIDDIVDYCSLVPKQMQPLSAVHASLRKFSMVFPTSLKIDIRSASPQTDAVKVKPLTKKENTKARHQEWEKRKASENRK